MAKQVEKVYGDALFAACEEAGDLDQLNEQVAFLGKLLRENPDFYKLLTHPDIAEDEKEQVLDDVCKSWAAPEFLGALKLMVQKERIGSVYKLFDYITVRYKDYRHIGVVSVTSAAPLSEPQKAALSKKILDTTQYKSLEMNYEVQPEIMGGLIIRIGDRVMDTSVKTRLEQMTRSLKTIQIK